MNQKSRYNFSVVRHRKNLQRSLNNFSMKHDVVTMYQMESDTWVFQFYDYVVKDENTDSKTKNQVIQNIEIEVFNRFEYETNIKNTKFIISVIKGMFEYQKYQSALIELLRSYEEKIIIEEHIVTQNNFFTKDQDKVLLDMGNQLRKMLKTELSNRFVKQLYTSLHNRIKFPNMYQNSYKESLESKYSKMRKSKKTTPYSNHFETTIKAYYNYYLQYSWLLKILDTFDYYIDESKDSFEFAENDEHVNNWRENYKFLKSNGIIDLLFQSMEFLATYIEIFSDDEMLPVSLTSQDGRIYENSVEKYIEENDFKVPYNLKDMTKIYRALHKNIDKDAQYKIEIGYLSHISERKIFLIDNANVEIRSQLKGVKQRG